MNDNYFIICEENKKHTRTLGDSFYTVVYDAPSGILTHMLTYSFVFIVLLTLTLINRLFTGVLNTAVELVI